MAKIIKKVKRWFHEYWQGAVMVIVILSVLGGGVYYAFTSEEKKVPQDFGDAETSELAQEVSMLSYEDGLRFLEQGDDVKGRAVMQRLAPVALSSTKPEGNPLAHLWMARTLLEGQEFGFLSKLPMRRRGLAQLESPVVLEESELSRRCMRHLEAAVGLDPQLSEAVQLLAEFMIARNQRNAAIKLLSENIAMTADTGLGMNLANALQYTGDDAAVEEAAWQSFAILGKDVLGDKRGDAGVRVGYLTVAMILKQNELVEAALAKFESDFNDREGGADLIAAMRVNWAYFRALQMLSDAQYNQREFVEHLLDAHLAQPGNEQIMDALILVTKHYPELKGLVLEKIGKVHAQLIAEEPQSAAKWFVLLSNIEPESARKYVFEAYRLDAKNPKLLARWTDYALEDPSADLQGLEQELLSVGQSSEELSVGERYLLALALGKVRVKLQRWKDALESLELAMTLTKGDRQPLHAMLAEVYDALGQSMLANEHRAAAQR